MGILAFFAYQQWQPHINYALASQFDGNDYGLAYAYFTDLEKAYSVPPPFHQRILIPWLASQLNTTVIKDFQWINLVFSLLSIWITFVLWRRLGFELKWMFFGFIWLIFHWTGLIRLNALDPITIDVAIYFFQALLLWLLIERKFIHLIWLAPLATCQKESFIGLMVILLLYALWHNKKERDGYFDIKTIIIALVLAIAANLIVHYYFPANAAGRNAFIMIAYQAKQILLNPFKLLRWLGAAAMAFGPALLLALAYYRKHFYLDNRRNLFVIFSIVSLAFGLLAGGDSTRIIFLGFPFLMTFTIHELQSSGYKIHQIALASLPLMMLPFKIPNPSYEWEAWQQWYPEFAKEWVVVVVITYTVIAAIIIKKGDRSEL